MKSEDCVIYRSTDGFMNTSIFNNKHNILIPTDKYVITVIEYQSDSYETYTPNCFGGVYLHFACIISVVFKSCSAEMFTGFVVVKPSVETLNIQSLS